MCTYPSARSHPQLVIDEIATAVWAVQMNTVTFHPWPVRSDDNDNPDEMRIDLDPQPGSRLRRCGRGGIRPEGPARGAWLHPVGQDLWQPRRACLRADRSTHEFLDVRHGVIGIGRELERRMPELVTTAWWKEERGEKVFVDFNQANRDRTIASAYSPRPLPGAPVSMPVPWERLREVKPGDFTVRTVPAILAAEGDAWAGIDAAVGNVSAAIALWDKGHRGTRAGGDALPSRLSEDARRAVKGAAEPGQEGVSSAVRCRFVAPLQRSQPATVQQTGNAFGTPPATGLIAGERRPGRRRWAGRPELPDRTPGHDPGASAAGSRCGESVGPPSGRTSPRPPAPGAT